MASKLRESLDTNIILRFILGDVPEQCLKIQDLLMRQNVMYDVADLVYVMQSTYGLSREKIVDGLQKLLWFPEINYNRNLFDQVFPMYLEHPKLSFNDCCLVVYANLNEAEPLWTFDRALVKRVPGAKLLA